jgi:hypothetical protein
MESLPLHIRLSLISHIMRHKHDAGWVAAKANVLSCKPSFDIPAVVQAGAGDGQ